MPTSDYDYYTTRAREERERARAANNQNVAEIHLKLAEKYDSLASEAEAGPTLRSGWDGSPTAAA